MQCRGDEGLESKVAWEWFGVYLHRRYACSRCRQRWAVSIYELTRAKRCIFSQLDVLILLVVLLASFHALVSAVSHSRYTARMSLLECFWWCSGSGSGRHCRQRDDCGRSRCFWEEKQAKLAVRVVLFTSAMYMYVSACTNRSQLCWYLATWCRRLATKVLFYGFAWPWGREWCEVVVECLLQRKVHIFSKKLITNCWPLCVIRTARIPYGTFQWWKMPDPLYGAADFDDEIATLGLYTKHRWKWRIESLSQFSSMSPIYPQWQSRTAGWLETNASGIFYWGIPGFWSSCCSRWLSCMNRWTCAASIDFISRCHT